MQDRHPLRASTVLVRTSVRIALDGDLAHSADGETNTIGTAEHRFRCGVCFASASQHRTLSWPANSPLASLSWEGLDPFANRAGCLVDDHGNITIAENRSDATTEQNAALTSADHTKPLWRVYLRCRFTRCTLRSLTSSQNRPDSHVGRRRRHRRRRTPFFDALIRGVCGAAAEAGHGTPADEAGMSQDVSPPRFRRPPLRLRDIPERSDGSRSSSKKKRRRQPTVFRAKRLSFKLKSSPAKPRRDRPRLGKVAFYVLLSACFPGSAQALQMRPFASVALWLICTAVLVLFSYYELLSIYTVPLINALAGAEAVLSELLTSPSPTAPWERIVNQIR